MFKVIKLEGGWWAVFLVSVRDEKDRYTMTSPLDKNQAERFQREFTRILNQE